MLGEGSSTKYRIIQEKTLRIFWRSMNYSP